MKFLLKQEGIPSTMTIFAVITNKWNSNMTQEYARVSVEMPENKEKKSLSQELTYEIENNDINDEFTVKF